MNLQHFQQDYYSGPFVLFQQNEVARIREELNNSFLNEIIANWPPIKQDIQVINAHLDNLPVKNIATNPFILDKVEKVLGKDIIIWRSIIWIKPPNNGVEVPWHKDIMYWGVLKSDLPINNVSAWIAIDDVTTENSCIQIVPNSLNNSQANNIKDLDVELKSEEYKDKILNMELRAGEFFLFNDRLAHRSSPNSSNKRRTAFVIRYTTPNVKVSWDNYKVMLVRGEDKFNVNKTVEI